MRNPHQTEFFSVKPISPIDRELFPLMPSVPSASFRDNTQAFLARQGLGKRVLGKMANVEEGKNGLSHVTVAQDLAIAWLPKMLLSRSLLEAGETTFLELLENVIIYYSIPVLGKHVFKRGIQAMLPGIDPSHLAKPLAEVPQALHQRVVPAKAGIILGALGLAIGAEYAVNYLKPLLTAKFTGKTSFSQVVALEQSHHQQGKHPEDDPFIHRMHQRLKNTGVVAGGVILSALALARFGHKLPGMAKPMGQFVHKMDFNFSADGSMSLRRNQMIAYMGLAIPGYLDATREKLETIEVGTRLALVIPYLIWFKNWMQGRMLQRVQPEVPDIVNADNSLKTIRQISEEAFSKAQSELPNAPPEALALRASELGAKLYNTRLRLFAVPLFTGVGFAGLGVGLLNRFWTQYRYEHTESPAVPSRALQASLAENQVPQLPESVLPIRNPFNVNVAAPPVVLTAIPTPPRSPLVISPPAFYPPALPPFLRA